MDAIGTIGSQSTAITAYTTQQQQTVGSPRKQDTSNSVGASSTQASNDAPQKAKSDQVSFTSEALRLSAQANQNSTATNTVNQANSTQNTNQYPPQSNSQVQAYQTAGAQSVAQAISTYHSTFKI
jgi:hypothetical protein